MLIHTSAFHLPLAYQSVQTVVTSPPYWGLRDYGLGENTLGLEATPEAYVQNIVKVFQQIGMVLRDDGTVWLNLGDSYVRAAEKGQHKPGDGGIQNYVIERGGGRAAVQFDLDAVNGYKPKDLIGIPWMVAFALRAEGWYLRADIIWHKTNPLPESVRDRPTKGHEYLFLLTKSERYYYDYEASKEPATGRSLGNRRHKYTEQYEAEESEQHRTKAGLLQVGAVERRNRRSVWSIALQPYAGAHFATFPEKLVEPCITAGSKLGDLVLDPFCGSGTVGRVAQQLGRRFVGCDLNYDYLQLAKHRIA